MADNVKWLSFDPTIHAGHLMTALTIIICTIGAYFAIISDVTFLKQENTNRKSEVAELKADVSERNKATDSKLDKMRDEMNGWFILLDQKLDKKADKR